MIENIIFDFGNVIIDISPETTDLEFTDIFGNENYLQAKKSDVFEAFEIGAITEDKFLDQLSIFISKKDKCKADIKTSWNNMLLNISPDKFDFLLRLKEEYNTYLLSNTNVMHMNWIYSYLEKEHNITDWNEKYFHHAYYSQEMSKRKPNTDIFIQVLKEQRTKAENCLFIDDREDNIETADSLGFHTILFDNKKMDLEESIRTYIQKK